MLEQVPPDLNEEQEKILHKLQQYAKMIEYADLNDFSQISRELTFKITHLVAMFALETWKDGRPSWPDFLREPPPPMVAPCPSPDCLATSAPAKQAGRRRKKSPAHAPVARPLRS